MCQAIGMSSALRKPMTRDEFLAWEERQEFKWEFDGFAPVAMNGGTVAHSTIQGNLNFVLQGRLRGGKCRPHGPNLKIEVAGSIRYPDMLVTCSPQAGRAHLATDTVVVFEIVSPSSSRIDRFVKAREYGDTDSIQRYVILEQTSQSATVFTRMNGIWASTVVDGDATLDVSEIGISVPLADIYLEVGFPPDGDAAG
jgi:Uma2 family endonuclease